MKLDMLGDVEILKRPKVGLFCSIKCPGKLILETYDLCRQFRDEGVIVASGFHSPMEEECLRILLRGTHPAIWCLARGMFKVIPKKYRDAVERGRLVLVSPFPTKIDRPTAKTALIRNRWVADMAQVLVVAYAVPGGKTEAFCKEQLAAGKPLYTFDHPDNAAILRAGARPIAPEIHWNTLLPS
jgi:predicted Rossmann fold nucleotide-binding protein DprA/Smf involved in DNA uptake